MFGFELTLQDDTVVEGTIYKNHTCYAHEPIVDMWHSIGDMLTELDDRVKEFKIVGPIVPTQDLLHTLDQDYQRKAAELDAARKQLEQAHQTARHEIERLEGEEGIKFIQKLEENREAA